MEFNQGPHTCITNVNPPNHHPKDFLDVTCAWSQMSCFSDSNYPQLAMACWEKVVLLWPLWPICLSANPVTLSQGASGFYRHFSLSDTTNTNGSRHIFHNSFAKTLFQALTPSLIILILTLPQMGKGTPVFSSSVAAVDTASSSSQCQGYVLFHDMYSRSDRRLQFSFPP